MSYSNYDTTGSMISQTAHPTETARTPAFKDQTSRIEPKVMKKMNFKESNKRSCMDILKPKKHNRSLVQSQSQRSLRCQSNLKQSMNKTLKQKLP